MTATLSEDRLGVSKSLNSPTIPVCSFIILIHFRHHGNITVTVTYNEEHGSDQLNILP